MKNQSLPAALSVRFLLLLGSSLALGLAGTAFAATPTLRLTLNGAASPETAIVVNGKTYVPVSALNRLGVKTATAGGVLSLSTGTAAPATANGAGGAAQKASVSGCMNEYLFNGIWRFRVLSVSVTSDPGQDAYPYYDVKAELKNGTTKTIEPLGTGIPQDNAVSLTFGDGNSMAYSYGGAWQKKVYSDVLQGTGFVFDFAFRPEIGSATREGLLANKPQKLLFEVDPAKLDKNLKVGFTVPDPSFRVDLTCSR